MFTQGTFTMTSIYCHPSESLLEPQPVCIVDITKSRWYDLHSRIFSSSLPLISDQLLIGLLTRTYDWDLKVYLLAPVLCKLPQIFIPSDGPAYQVKCTGPSDLPNLTFKWGPLTLKQMRIKSKKKGRNKLKMILFISAGVRLRIIKKLVTNFLNR